MKILGIISFTSPSTNLGEIEKIRPVSACSFFGRYRLIDFPLSNFSNSHIDRIMIFSQKNARALVEHVGEGRQYNFNSKRSNISFVIDYFNSTIYSNDLDLYHHHIEEINNNEEEYVVIAPSNIIYCANYNDLVQEHIENGNDISILYKAADNCHERYLNSQTLMMDKTKKLINISYNQGNYKNRNISLETYILSKDLFIKLLNQGKKISSLYWWKDVINELADSLNIRGISFKKPFYPINSFNDYYQANLDIIENGDELFKNNWPIYTKTNDSVPTYFGKKSDVANSMIANGAVINGTVINSIVGRNSKIEEGAIVKNSVILDNVYVASGVIIDNAVIDSFTKISHAKDILVDSDEIIYICKGDTV